MKSRKIIFIGFISLAVLSSCDDLIDTRTTKEIVQELEGQWMCDETSQIFKNVQSPYEVYITPSTSDSTRIFISNFYQLGNDVEATAIVNNYSITLPAQTLPGDYTVSGSGTISQNLKEIKWTYSVDDGSGEKDDVTATYTLQY